MTRSIWTRGVVGLGLAALVASAFPLEALAQPALVEPTYRRYCIRGSADANEGLQWDWRVEREGEATDQGRVTAADEDPAIVLATLFAESVNTQPPAGRVRADVLGDDPDLVESICGPDGWEAVFQIENVLNTEGFLLRIIPVADAPAECRVDFLGGIATGGLEFEGGTHCNFNPTISVGQGVPVPGLERRGMVTLVLLVLAAASALILGRRFPPGA